MVGHFEFPPQYVETTNPGLEYWCIHSLNYMEGVMGEATHIKQLVIHNFDCNFVDRGRHEMLQQQIGEEFIILLIEKLFAEQLFLLLLL